MGRIISFKEGLVMWPHVSREKLIAEARAAGYAADDDAEVWFEESDHDPEPPRVGRISAFVRNRESGTQ